MTQMNDDTHVFVPLMHLVNPADMNSASFDTNATFADLGQKCLQLAGMLTLSRCDTISYPYDKGKVTALNTGIMISRNYFR